uniref:Uncharacterized protein n=1 Tax=Arundo donax TaxID=35708 RepID=A0A0A9F9I4_ARUDO
MVMKCQSREKSDP